jgi:hypothetical protein
MSVHATHRPRSSGYEEAKPTQSPVRDQPDLDAAGNQRAQVAASAGHGIGKPDEEQQPKPEEDEPVPPGEHKREPIKDPDPADTKLHVRRAAVSQASR